MVFPKSLAEIPQRMGLGWNLKEVILICPRLAATPEKYYVKGS